MRPMPPRPSLTRAPLSCLPAALAAALLLAGCGREPSAAMPAAAATQEDAIARAGDISVRASTVPTALLGEAVAREYGITRGDGTVLLLVAVRTGPDGEEASLPATVTAAATDLRGREQAIAVRELRSGELLDYIGVVEVSPPETLRFALKVTPEGAAPMTLQFNRDFYPR